MKKRVVTIFGILACCFMTACGGSDTPPSSTTAPVSTGVSSSSETASDSTQEEVKTPEATSVPEATKAPEKQYTDIYTFEMKFNGDSLKFPMWYSDLEAKGWVYRGNPENELAPNDYYLGIWEKDSVQYTFYMYNSSVNATSISRCAIAGFSTEVYYVPEGYVQNVELPGGIKSSVATKEDIIDTYGDPTDIYEGATYEKLKYEYDEYEYVHLTVEDGVFTVLEIRNRIDMEEVMSEVSNAIPDYVEGYQAPTSNTGEAADLIFAVDEVYYKLPCPVAELLKNGFILLSDYQNLTLTSGAYGEIELRYGNNTVECQVKNFAKYATVLENCFVTRISADKLDLSVLGGIRPGISEAEVEALLSGMEYEKEESIHAAYGMGGNNYSLESVQEYDYFIMTDKDGIVNHVQIDSKRTAPENGTGAATDKMYQRVAVEVPEDSIYSFWMNKDGDKFKLPMWYSEMAAMGWEFQDDATVKLHPGEGLATQTWKKDDFTIRTVLYNPTINTAVLSDCLIIEISLDVRSAALFKPYTGTITLPGGTQMFASTKEEVHAVYGTPGEENEVEYLGDTTYFMTYSDGDGGYVKFSIDNYPVEYNGKTYENVLSSVEMRNKKPVEGGDNTVSEKKPVELDLYTTPTDFKDTYNMVFNMEGEMYQLPCPVSEFVKNGFRIVEADSDAYIPAMGSGTVVFFYNNKRFECVAGNLSEKATTIDNCFIVSLSVTTYEDTVDITVLDTINVGCTEDELLTALKGLNYTLNSSEYRVYAPNGDGVDCYAFYVVDGIVKQLYITNHYLPRKGE